MISAIILAGGKGKRMRSAISKQFIDIKGKPIIYYTLKKFSENKKILPIKQPNPSSLILHRPRRYTCIPQVKMKVRSCEAPFVVFSCCRPLVQLGFYIAYAQILCLELIFHSRKIPPVSSHRKALV